MQDMTGIFEIFRSRQDIENDCRVVHAPVQCAGVNADAVRLLLVESKRPMRNAAAKLMLA